MQHLQLSALEHHPRERHVRHARAGQRLHVAEVKVFDHTTLQCGPAEPAVVERRTRKRHVTQRAVREITAVEQQGFGSVVFNGVAFEAAALAADGARGDGVQVMHVHGAAQRLSQLCKMVALVTECHAPVAVVTLQQASCACIGHVSHNAAGST